MGKCRGHLETFIDVLIRVVICRPQKKFSPTNKQMAFAGWNVFFFIVCVINSVFVIYFRLYDNEYFVAFFLPFAHAAVFAVASGIWSCRIIIKTASYRSPLLLAEGYVAQNYPEIWKKLHPWGEFSRNDFAFIAFLRGKYDNGNDDELNRIKYVGQVRFSLAFLPFLIVISIWVVNLFLLLLKFDL